jgi:hypothetical protein
VHPLSKAGVAAISKVSVGMMVAGSLTFSAGVAGAGTGKQHANPCRLLKTSDVEKVFGSDDIEAEGRDASGFRCIWSVNGGLTGDGPQVSISYDTGPDAATSFEGFSDSGKPVPGLGDDSYYNDLLGLHVLSDGEYLVVEADYGLLGEDAPSERQIKKDIVTLAKKALARQ